MDDRIRAAERSGDRQRLLVELHRAGRPIDWWLGDKVIVNMDLPTASKLRAVGEITGIFVNPDIDADLRKDHWQYKVKFTQPVLAYLNDKGPPTRICERLVFKHNLSVDLE